MTPPISAAADGELGVGGCTVFFDAPNGTLYFEDYDDGASSIGTFAEGDLTVSLSGENRFSSINVSNGALTVEGEGKLSLSGPHARLQSSGSLMLRGGIIEIERHRKRDGQGSGGVIGSAVMVTGDTVLDVAVSGGSNAMAIHSTGGNVIIAGDSRVTLDARDSGIYEYGIRSSNDIHISTHGFLDITVDNSILTFPSCHAMTSAPFITGANYNITGEYNGKEVTYTFNGPSHRVTVEGGSGSGDYLVGKRVMISAGDPPEGEVFDKWTSPDGVDFTDAHSRITGFYMPARDVTVTANYKERPSYRVTAVGGRAHGDNYYEGDIVLISADDPPPGKVFGGWSSEDGVDFYNETSADTTFTMPARNVTVEAIFWDHLPIITTVMVFPSNDVPRGSTAIFNASVLGSGDYNHGVTWSLVGGAAGTAISDLGFHAGFPAVLLTVAPDETAQTLTVIATSTADPTISGSATVTITGDPVTRNIIVYGGAANKSKAAAGETVTITAGAPPAGQQFDRWSSGEVIFADTDSEVTTFVMPAQAVIITAEYSDIPVSITGVTVSPSEAHVVRGGSLSFTAAVSGTGLYLETVSWKVSGGGTGTAIDHEGRLTVAAGETAQTLTVTAASVADPGKIGTSVVNVSAVLYGDLNGDGKITVQDAILLLRSIVGLTKLTPAEKTAADVDGSGAVNVADAVLILRYIVGLISSFPAAA